MKVERQIIGTTAALLLLAAAVVGFVIVPTVTQIRDLTDELANQQMEIERQYILRNYVKRALTDIETAQAKFDKIKDTSIMQGEELQFIQALERAANVSGVAQQISLETVNEVELTLWEKEIPLKLHIQGAFPNVMSWLNEVEHLEYYILFDSISISAQRLGGAASPQGNVNASFVGRTFWLSKDAPYFLDFHDLPDLEIEEKDEEEEDVT